MIVRWQYGRGGIVSSVLLALFLAEGYGELKDTALASQLDTNRGKRTLPSCEPIQT